MSIVANLLNKSSSQNTVFDGIIAKDVEGISDLAPVIVPAFHPELEFCRAPWMPREVDAFPTEGDRCVVVLAETEEAGTPEAWIVAWWPYGD